MIFYGVLICLIELQAWAFRVRSILIYDRLVLIDRIHIKKI